MFKKTKLVNKAKVPFHAIAILSLDPKEKVYLAYYFTSVVFSENVKK
jgi:hypothetical protein